MASTLRVCDLTTLFIEDGEGGVNTYLQEKSNYLGDRSERFEHTLVVPTETNCVKRFGSSKLYGIASPRYFRNPQHRVVFNHRAVRQLIRELRPDIIEIDCATLLGRVAARALPERPPQFVGFYHVHLPTYYARPFMAPLGELAASLAERLAWTYVRFCGGPCERIMVSSNSILQELDQKGFQNLEHVPLGVNLDLFQPSSETEPQSEGDLPLILYVGRLSHEKNLPVLFEAYDLLAQQGRYRLRIVGDGPLRRAAEAFAATREDVEFLGPYPYGEELAQLYREADVFALPSPSETFGLIVLESLASGIPVVGIRQGGPEYLLREGLGELVQPNNASEFAEKLSSVICKRKPAAHYRAPVEKNYSWEKTFERIVSVYYDTIEGRGDCTEPDSSSPVFEPIASG